MRQVIGAWCYSAGTFSSVIVCARTPTKARVGFRSRELGVCEELDRRVVHEVNRVLVG
jgi:hypothetical protein